MARGTFGRTVVKTFCEVRYVDENNDVKDGEVLLWGDYDIFGAQNAARKRTGNKRLVVKAVRHESFYGVISLEDFEANCSVIRDRKEW